MELNEEFYRKLDKALIKISFNKNPIKMDLFFSFLKIDVVKIKDHLGSSTGWTRYENSEISLIITGGIVKGVNYLDHIEYGKNLENPYNNYL